MFVEHGHYLVREQLEWNIWVGIKNLRGLLTYDKIGREVCINYSHDFSDL